MCLILAWAWLVGAASLHLYIAYRPVRARPDLRKTGRSTCGGSLTNRFAQMVPLARRRAGGILCGVTANRSAPWARIVPVLAVADVHQAVAWYVSVLGLVEHVRVGAGHRVQLGFDGERAELIVRELGDEERIAERTDQVMVRVADANGVLEAARSHGADASVTAHDWPYGEWQASFVDPFGHRWVVTQTLQDVDPRDWGGETVVPRR